MSTIDPAAIELPPIRSVDMTAVLAQMLRNSENVAPEAAIAR